ncbi:MAG: hypothetical protein AB1529_01390 [Candidatus Micrarchaeota archaeon]
MFDAVKSSIGLLLVQKRIFAGSLLMMKVAMIAFIATKYEYFFSFDSSAIFAPLIFDGIGIFLISLYFAGKKALSIKQGAALGWSVGMVSALVDTALLLLFVLYFLTLSWDTRGQTPDPDVGFVTLQILLIAFVLLILGRLASGLFIGIIPGILGSAMGGMLGKNK